MGDDSAVGGQADQDPAQLSDTRSRSKRFSVIHSPFSARSADIECPKIERTARWVPLCTPHSPMDRCKREVSESAKRSRFTGSSVPVMPISIRWITNYPSRSVACHARPWGAVRAALGRTIP